MRRSILFIITLLIVTAVFAGCSMITSPLESSGSADALSLAPVAPEATHFSLPPGFTTAEIEVSSAAKDYTFGVIGCYMFDTETASFEFRVYQSELDYYTHYLQAAGYSFDGFNGWTFVPEGQYYTASFVSLNDVELQCIHTPLTYSVTFVDGISGDTIQTMTASYGSSVTAPSARDYSSEGLVFTGWQGGSFDSVTRNATLYSTYAPARYITVKLPDDTTVRLAVAEGTVLEDVSAPDFEGKTFKEWQTLDGDTIDAANTVILFDATYAAEYSGFELPQWASTLLIVLCSLAGAAIIISIAVKIFRKKVR